MLYGIIVVIVGFLIANQVIRRNFILRSRQDVKDMVFIKNLFFYHLLLSIVYYIYAVFNPSDSLAYYNKVRAFSRGETWSDFYGVSTTFIEWIGFPFINYLGFSYEAIMALFSFFGFIGFIYFFRFFRENVIFTNKVFNYDMLYLFFLLPNLHFWSGSFGKGALIFLAIGLVFYSMNNIPKRWALLVIGGVLAYHIRPHIMFVLIVSTIIGFTFSTKKLGLFTRVAIIAMSVIAFFFIYQDTLRLVGVQQGQVLTQGLDLSRRAFELSKATSGIDISNYSIPALLFTFLFRPLFFDAPGFLGIIVSFENVFLLIITAHFLSKGGLKYIVKGDFLIKTAFLSFLTVSIALAQISGNLGIAIRQKSQVMLLFLFVIVRFFDDKKLKTYMIHKSRQLNRAKKKETTISTQP